MDSDESFWVVWNPGHGVPHMKHANEESAEREAKRLASANAGQVFYVLEANSAFVKDDVRRIPLMTARPF